MKSKFSWRSPGHAFLLVFFIQSVAIMVFYTLSYDFQAFRGGFASDPCWSYTTNRSRSEVIASLGQLIVVTANLDRADLRKMLTETLYASQADMRLLLCRLEAFAKTFRCSNCSDERPLPRTALSPALRLAHSASWRGHALPVMITMPTGRLGNVMGEYASLYALHKIYNVTAFITPQHKSIMKMFPNLSLRPIEIGRVEDWRQLGPDVPDQFAYASLQLAAAGLLGPLKFMSKDFPFERQLFNAFREDILHEFSFSDHLLNKTAVQLARVATLTAGSVHTLPLTFIGVHIRLTDYPSHMKNRFGVTLTYDLYLTRAVRHYQRLHDNAVFVVTSDNQSYARSFFKNIGENNTFIFSGSPDEDLCLLAHCNHSIVTFGTYGFWSGYLSPGTTVYPDMPISKKPYPHSKFFYELALLDNFIPLPML